MLNQWRDVEIKEAKLWIREIKTIQLLKSSQVTMSGKKVFSFLSFFWFSAFLFQGRFIRPTSPFVTLPSSFIQFALAKQYPADLNGKSFITEMQNLPPVHKVNFECAQFNTIGPVELINTVQSFREFQQVASVIIQQTQAN